MAGNTAAIDRLTLEIQWESYEPMAAICSHWTITKDQLIRLRDVWALPLRLDRARRYKPGRDDRLEEPTPEEEAASLAGLALAPMVAARVTSVQAHWSEREWRDRQVSKPLAYTLARIDVPEDTRGLVEDLSREVQW